MKKHFNPCTNLCFYVRKCLVLFFEILEKGGYFDSRKSDPDIRLFCHFRLHGYEWYRQPSVKPVHLRYGRVFRAYRAVVLLLIVLVGTFGNTIGNVILYEVSCRKGLKYVTRWRGFSEERIIKLQCAFKRRGSVIIFIGKFLPGVKVFVPVVAGIACMNRMLYAVIITVTSFLWALGLTYFGVYFGRNYSNGTFGWYSFTLIILAIVAIYLFHKYVQSISLEKVVAKS